MDPQLIRQIRKVLLEKYGVNLPPDVTPETCGRDLLGALTAHPGYEVHPDLIAEAGLDDEDDAGDLGEVDDDYDDEDDDAGRRQLSHGRRPITAARAAQVADEFCKNTGLI